METPVMHLIEVEGEDARAFAESIAEQIEAFARKNVAIANADFPEHGVIAIAVVKPIGADFSPEFKVMVGKLD